jgi:hypothetical protein
LSININRSLLDYLINQINCYIIILPAFGIISQVISAFSSKPVFGQNGPVNILCSLQQTICRKLNKINEKIIKIFNFILQNTKIINNFYYFILVKIFVICFNNPQITKARIIIILFKSEIIHFWLSMRVGISEAIRLLFVMINFKSYKNILISYLLNKNFSTVSRSKNKLDIDKSFNEWLAGLIDGDGCFQLSKKGYASLEIVMELKDKHCLYQIKNKFGGSVKLRAGFNHLRYRLHHKEGLLKLIYAVNGLIRNPVRLNQLNKIGKKYDINILQSSPLTYNNGWLAGFIDSDGSIYLNLKSDQLFITISQKNKLLLDPLIDLYGGKIYILKSVEAFKWIIYRKEEIINILDYFTLYPLRSAKHNRIKLIPKYYELKSLKAHKATKDSILGKAWNYFLTKWDKYEN